MPAAGQGFKRPGRAQKRARRELRVRGYAMNMRAAEATVSNAPKAMKILPISEV